MQQENIKKPTQYIMEIQVVVQHALQVHIVHLEEVVQHVQPDIIVQEELELRVQMDILQQQVQKQLMNVTYQ